MDPFGLLKQAVKAVPAVRYAVGVAGIAAVVALVLGLQLRPQVAVFGTLIVIALMFVLVVFSRFAGQAQHSDFVGPARTLVWFYTLAIVTATTLFVTSYFFHTPLDLGHQSDFPSNNATVSDPSKYSSQSTSTCSGLSNESWAITPGTVSTFTEPNGFNDYSIRLNLKNLTRGAMTIRRTGGELTDDQGHSMTLSGSSVNPFYATTVDPGVALPATFQFHGHGNDGKTVSFTVTVVTSADGGATITSYVVGCNALPVHQVGH